MKEQHANEFWTQYLDGDLTARQRAALKQLLSASSARRDRFLDDVQFDGMLRTLGHIDATEDDFVTQVAARLDEIDAEVEEFPLAPAPEKHPDASPLSTVPPPPPVPPPIEFDDSEMQVRRPDERQDALSTPLTFRARIQRHAFALALGTAALLLVLLTGAIVFVTSQNTERVADDRDESRSSVDDKLPPNQNQGRAANKRPNSQVVAKPLPKSADIPPNDSGDQVPKFVDQPNPSQDERGVAGINENRTPIEPANDNSPQPTPTATALTPSEDTAILARVTKSVEANWKSGPQTELTTKPLALTSGMVEVTTNDGVSLTVLGPAEFQLDSASRVVLTRGCLHAYVPEQAIGFTVKTPSSQVVDLGTEFDVSVDERGETAVRVHQGEIQFASLPSNDSESVKWNLHKGQFKTLRRDGVSYDFCLTTKLDGSGRGTIYVNGIEFTVVDRKDFDAARAKVNEELRQFRRDVVDRRDSAYSGIANLDGKLFQFGTSNQFRLAWRQVNAYFERVGNLLNRSGSFSGSININGNSIQFGNLEELYRLRDRLRNGGARGNNRGDQPK